jgi:hypothetical protein
MLPRQSAELRRQVTLAGGDYELWLYRREGAARRFVGRARGIDTQPAGTPPMLNQCIVDANAMPPI